MTNYLHAVAWFGGPLLTLLGVLVSIGGTYLLTRTLHPYDVSSFVEHVIDSPEFAMALLTKWRIKSPSEEIAPHWKQKLQELEDLAKLAEANPERGSVSLVGVDLVFIGFLLQFLGGVLLVVDVVWSHV
jgi:hypothetical protein